jgi:hypothetical protein
VKSREVWDPAQELEDSGQYFMVAIALAFAMETAALAYLLVEFGEENGGELEIPDNVGMADLIESHRGDHFIPRAFFGRSWRFSAPLRTLTLLRDYRMAAQLRADSLFFILSTK